MHSFAMYFNGLKHVDCQWTGIRGWNKWCIVISLFKFTFGMARAFKKSWPQPTAYEGYGIFTTVLSAPEYTPGSLQATFQYLNSLIVRDLTFCCIAKNPPELTRLHNQHHYVLTLLKWSSRNFLNLSSLFWDARPSVASSSGTGVDTWVKILTGQLR